jgi:cell division protein FtsB
MKEKNSIYKNIHGQKLFMATYNNFFTKEGVENFERCLMEIEKRAKEMESLNNQEKKLVIEIKF